MLPAKVPCMSMQKTTTIIILNNIRSAHNVGSIFRTAEASGVKKMFLTGYTPTPIDRFGRKQGMISKTALGAEDAVLWKYLKTVHSLLASLKGEGYEIIGVEQSSKSIPYKKAKVSKKRVFIFGNEVRGLSKQLQKKCDKIIEIPMSGKKESLNVSVSAGIILFHFS